MKNERAETLIGRCAEVAGRAPKITAYVLIYQEKDGTVRYHRDGHGSTQLGMVELMKTGIINGMTGGDNDE